VSAPRLAATIIIPTHDRPELLERAVASALAQTVRDIQVVVVEDGSAEPV
jgi:glycosyltransferase involved in cell wall biosynthesis